jgi:8-oxo-dGTP pyrophosphatase MutT (NUDIX family)
MAREEKQHKIEVHVAGLCFRETQCSIEILIVKRQMQRKLYPGLWECGGGQVRLGENFLEAIKRQIQEELGIIVDEAWPFRTYEIKTRELKQKKIPGVKFVCLWNNYVNRKEPQIDKKEHSQWKWQSIDNLSEIDFIPGIKKDIRQGWEFYVNNKNMLISKRFKILSIE